MLTEIESAKNALVSPPVVKAEYRAEIDGLRAIAVLGVIFFHLRLGLFKGGFAGVDIFFVISGYLITRNILSDANAGSFSFSGFYVRRARRILPALIFTVACTFWLGFIWLPPQNLQLLAGEATHALLSISNIQYWRDAHAYFAHSSDQLALLHCWSLSLEEQFYLFWPVFILFVRRQTVLRQGIACAAIASLCAALFYALRDPQAVFFLMPFRIFEFAIGASVIFIQPLLSTAAMSVTGLFGLLAVCASLTLLDSDSSFALVSLLPSLGAAAIICAGTKHHLSKLLTNAPARFLGRISYSLYLCHWPILFFARFLYGDNAESWQGMGLSFAVMLAVAFAMQRLVEQPFRSPRQNQGSRKIVIAFVLLTAASVIVNNLTVQAGGWPGRFPADENANSDLKRFGAWPCSDVDGARCAFGQLNAPLGVELLGDSHAMQYIAALEPFLQTRHMRAEVTKVLGCPVLAGVSLKGERADACRAVRDRELSNIAKTSTPVIIAQRWILYSDDTLTFDGLNAPETADGKPYAVMQNGLERTIQQLGKDGRTFLIVGAQVTANKECTFEISRRLPALLRPALPFNCGTKSREQAESDGLAINNMLRNVQAKWPDRIRLLIPVDYFCKKECPIIRDGILLYTDGDHFTVAGSRYMGERAHELLENFLDRGSRIKPQ